jgi:hypothetical protein
MKLRILVGIGLSCLMDISFGLFFTLLMSKVMDHHVSIWTYGLGVLLALSPDFDVLFQKFQKREIDSEHRDIGLHYPVIMLPVFILFSLFSLFWSFLIGLCLLSHFIHDSIGEGPGLKWLWPFSHRYYKFFAEVNGKRICIRSLALDEAKQLSLTLGKWIETYYLSATPQVIIGIIAFILAVILILPNL